MKILHWSSISKMELYEIVDGEKSLLQSASLGGETS